MRDEYGGTGCQLIQQGAHFPDDLQVGALGAAPDVVVLADPTCLQHPQQSAHVIFHEQPVAHVPAIAVELERLPGEDPHDRQRDQLLGELVRAIVVGAVGEQDGQAVRGDTPAPGGR